MIHGTSTSSWQWKYVQFYLRLKNISYITPKYNHQQRIPLSTDEVFRQIKNIKRNNFIIGHTQGVLIAICLHDKLESRGTFLLNTPQKGSSLLSWLLSETDEKKSSFDMRPYSKFIKDLLIINENTYEIIGINDFVCPHKAIRSNVNVYHSWFSHYFNTINPYLWFFYILKKNRIKYIRKIIYNYNL